METFELVNWYLEHPEERQRIARQGQQEVYEKHTYHHRLQSILPLLSAPPKIYHIPFQAHTPAPVPAPAPVPSTRGVVRAGCRRVTINL